MEYLPATQDIDKKPTTTRGATTRQPPPNLTGNETKMTNHQLNHLLDFSHALASGRTDHAVNHLAQALFQDTPTPGTRAELLNALTPLTEFLNKEPETNPDHLAHVVKFGDGTYLGQASTRTPFGGALMFTRTEAEDRAVRYPKGTCTVLELSAAYQADQTREAMERR